ncbi:hypothetical protein [Paraburkholderia megapolitana]|uniref:hypothetical protein n=1 Tax=Paraburkholderia megapolitana TaxID=420953 RepID=UPI0038BC8578
MSKSRKGTVRPFVVSTVIRSLLVALATVTLVSACGSGSGGNSPAASSSSSPSASAPPSTEPTAQQHILFVGDSFTHGRYTPVRLYNSMGSQTTTPSAIVVDENYGQTGARAELEPGPWGGIPGIFAELAFEANLNYDVHIEAISETSLSKNFTAASSVIAQSRWNAVVLQELSEKPLPKSLTDSSISDPVAFCSSVQSIESAVHGAAPKASVYLYETWPRADLATSLAGGTSAANFNSLYLNALSTLGSAYHNVYYSAAAHDGAIAGVAPAGEAWQRAWAEDVANPDPHTATGLPVLWYGINATNNPPISAPDYLHPSIYGAYLSGLVLFDQITRVDPRHFGASEIAAEQLGIPASVATQLQRVAWETVQQENATPQGQTIDPCTAAQS